MLIDIMTPEVHSGITLIIALSSSTWSTVQRSQAFEADPSGAMSCSGFLMMQALFRNLHAHCQHRMTQLN